MRLPPGGGRAAYRARVRLARTMWTLAFLVLVFVPLVLAPLAGGVRRPWSKGGIWVELCLTSGLLGLSTLAATIVLPSRVKSLTRAFGIEEVLRSHRWLAVFTTVVVVLHVVFIVIDRPLNVLLLSPMDTGANRARAGLIGTVSMVLLCILSLKRRTMGTRYAVWRWFHAIAAIGALGGTYFHIFWLHHLMQNLAEATVMVAILVVVSAVLINRWILRPFASLRHPYLIREVRPESPTVSTLVLTPAKRHQRPMAYRPGQFAWLRLDSPFGPLQGNPFSIASGEDSPRDIEFTIRNAGDFTATVAGLAPGRKVFLDGPYGDFNTDAGKGDSVLLIAGGVGIAPIISILRSHASRGDLRPHCLLMAARTPGELLFRPELHHLTDHLDLRVIEVVSAPPPGWTGITGRIGQDLLQDVIQAEGLHQPQVLICASGPMTRDLRTFLTGLDISPHQIRTEEFDQV